MFKLKDQFRAARWSSFPETEDIKGGRLECPGCGMLYVGHVGQLVCQTHAQLDPKNVRYLAAQKLKREGKTVREIAEELGVSASMAHRILKEHIGRKTP